MNPSRLIQSRRHPRLRAWSLFLLAVSQAGCGPGWHQPPSPEAIADLRPRQQVQVWSRGVPRQLHAVRLTADSVTGIPYLKALDCDSCRIALPRAAVDSLRLGNPPAGFWRSLGLGYVIVAGIIIAGCIATHGCDYGE